MDGQKRDHGLGWRNHAIRDARRGLASRTLAFGARLPPSRGENLVAQKKDSVFSPPRRDGKSPRLIQNSNTTHTFIAVVEVQWLDIKSIMSSSSHRRHRLCQTAVREHPVTVVPRRHLPQRAIKMIMEASPQAWQCISPNKAMLHPSPIMLRLLVATLNSNSMRRKNKKWQTVSILSSLSLSR